MEELAKRHLVMERRHITLEEGRKMFKDQSFKLDLLEDFAKENRELTAYTLGNFTDLCAGGHCENTKEISPGSFTLTKISGAYWRANEKNPMLTRIYGLAFDTKEELEKHLHTLEEAKKRDHRKLGVELDLFTFSDLVGAGLPLWTPRGTLLRNLLDAYVWELRQNAGYERVEIPHITKKDLYERSGHWDKYKDDLMRVSTREGYEFAMKPMNCPHHTQIYARKLWSYRELPQRYSNTTMCYRDEQSGELSGLSRVRAFTQDDAHVFCRMSQAKEEFLKIWDIVHTFYGSFGFSMRVRISKHDPAHPEKYLGDRERWAFAEGMLTEIAKEKGADDAFDGIGEAAFYGPKLDFMAKDAIGREWQVATIQLDMNMPERFELSCVNEKGEKERIVMIHAAIMGSIERFLSILIEHTAGEFPLWLSPVQARVLPIGEKHQAFAMEATGTLRAAGLRVEMDASGESLGKRIRETKLAKIPYTLIIGDREVAMAGATLESRSGGKIGQFPISEISTLLSRESENRS
jgi:threonyl-tRNA synthetase